MDRRDFIKHSFMATAASACSSLFPVPALASAPAKRILVLGGSLFVGPALVDAALAAGHSVTLFNRGVTNPNLFPYLEKLRGFRSVNAAEENFSALGTREWDAVVDVWPYHPEMVVSAAKVLKSRTKHYLYVSSIAAYEAGEYAKSGINENATLASWTGPERIYKRGKAESERQLNALIGDKLTIVRPGPIKGDRDPGTEDLSVWLLRAQVGKKHIGPGDGNEHVQIVDVKDVARFLVLAIDQSIYGTFNLTGRPMSFREFLDGCKAATHSEAEFLWIPQGFLHQKGLDPQGLEHGGGGGYFPLWHPEPENRGLFQISSQKAFKAGWHPRPFDETVSDTLIYLTSLDPTVFSWSDYLDSAKEAQVIGEWERSIKR